MQKRSINSGKIPVGTDVGKNLYATVNPHPPEPGSRLREAAPPAGPRAAPVCGTGVGSVVGRLLPRPHPRRQAPACPHPRRQAPASLSPPSGGCPPPSCAMAKAYHPPIGFRTEPKKGTRKASHGQLKYPVGSPVCFHDPATKLLTLLRLASEIPVGIPFGEGESVGFPFAEGLFAGFPFGEARSAGFAFAEGDSVGISFGEPHQTHFHQIHPRQTRFQQTWPRQTDFQQETPRQTIIQQIANPVPWRFCEKLSRSRLRTSCRKRPRQTPVHRLSFLLTAIVTRTAGLLATWKWRRRSARRG